MIILSFASGIAIFFLAPLITDNDLNRKLEQDPYLQVVKTEIDNNQKIIAKIKREIDSTKNKIDSIKNNTNSDDEIYSLKIDTVLAIADEYLKNTLNSLGIKSDDFEIINTRYKGLSIEHNTQTNSEGIVNLSIIPSQLKFYKNDQALRFKNFIKKDSTYQNLTRIFRSYYLVFQLKLKSPDLNESIAKLKNNINRYKMDSLNRQRLSLENKSLERKSKILEEYLTSNENIDYTRLIQTNITRFGSLILLLFLIKILIPQYRYYIKLSNFYAARADSLELLPLLLSINNYESITNILTPNYEFGSSPDTPYESIVEILKEIRANQAKT